MRSIRRYQLKQTKIVFPSFTGEKTLIKLIENNKGKEVTENKLRLKANQLENIVSQNNGHVQLLEKQKIDMETVRQHFLRNAHL